MTCPRSQARAVLAALAMSVLAIGSVAGVAEARPPMAVTFHASNAGCVTGTSNRKLANVDLYGIVHGGHSRLVESDFHVTVHTDHSFRVCFGHAVKPGMALAAVSTGNHDVSWVIPTMKLRIDRVTDVVRGSVSTAEPSYTLAVRAFQCSVITLGGPCPRVVKRPVTADSTGHYLTDLSTAYDLRGSDLGVGDLPVDVRDRGREYVQARAVDTLHGREGR